MTFLFYMNLPCKCRRKAVGNVWYHVVDLRSALFGNGNFDIAYAEEQTKPAAASSDILRRALHCKLFILKRSKYDTERTIRKMLDYVIQTLETLVNIPSPSGFTGEAEKFVTEEAEKMGFTVEHLNKGGVIITVPGKTDKVLGLSAHLDTLGAMVRSVTGAGTLRMVPVGGYMMETIEGTYCTVHTRDGRKYDGTVLTTAPSVHTYDNCDKLERKASNMEIRLDEKVKTKEDVEALGIGAGAFISFDPGFVHTKSGFVKSRHLDDKASVAVLLGLLKYISTSGNQPEQTLKVLITCYEEIGHGASYIPQDITELLVVDMGALGEDLTGDEYKVSICALDSSGPYDYDMTNELIRLAEERKLEYAIDIFPHYGSDGSAALRGGNNIRCALIGQGVHASHSMERTHEEGLRNTLELVKAYIGL